jgi:hypothetical protein
MGGYVGTPQQGLSGSGDSGYNRYIGNEHIYQTTATQLPHQVYPDGVLDKGYWTVGTSYVAGDMVAMASFDWVATCNTVASAATIPGASPCWQRVLKPQVALDFSTAQITPRSGSSATADAQFTRASTATVTDYLGGLVTVPVDVPRFQGARWEGGQWYATTPGDAPIPGITYLNEPAATNLIAKSTSNLVADIGIASAGAIISTTSLPTPAGTVEDVMTMAVNTTTYLRQGSLPEGVICSSMWVKQLTPGPVSSLARYLYSWAQTTSYVILNLQTMQIDSVIGNVLGYGVEAGLNGWYRIWVAGNTTGDAVTRRAQFTLNGGVGQKVAMWGWQCETGAARTAYIPTTGAVATRAADDLRILGGPQADFSVQAAFTIGASVVSSVAWRLFGSKDARGTNNEILTSGAADWAVGTASGGLSQNMNIAATPAKHCFGASYANNRQSVYFNGAQVRSGVAAWTPDHSNQYWQAGRSGVDSTAISVRYSSFVLFPSALPEEDTKTLGTTPMTVS